MPSNSLLRIVIVFMCLVITLCSCSEEETGGAISQGTQEQAGEYAPDGPDQLNELVWKFKTDGPITTSPAISGGVVYTSGGGNLYAVDSQIGQEKSRFRTFGHITSPVISDGVVYFGSTDGYLYAVK